MTSTTLIRSAIVWIVVAAGAPVLLAPPAQAKAEACTIVGTSGDDVLRGTPGDDVICGLRGDDTIFGRGGDDLLHGNAGDDVLRGGPGEDLVYGDRGNDKTYGDGGDDVVRGYEGNDLEVGGPGDDRIGGYRGADVVDGRDDDRFRDVLMCGAGPDTAKADTDDRVLLNCEIVIQNHRPSAITLTPSSIAENEPAGTEVGDLAATDADAGDSATFALVPGTGDDDNGRFVVVGDTLESDESFDFETDATLLIRVSATDESGATAERRLTVTVTDVGENPPVAVDDTFSTPEDTRLDLPVSGAGSPAANDTDSDADPLTVTAVSGASGGSVAIVSGQVQFSPTGDLCGVGAGGFDYTVSDGTGNTDQGAVDVDITCVDDQPVAVDDSATVPEDDSASAIDVLGNDTDADGDPITVDSASDPAGGTVVLTGPAGARTGLTYVPDPDYCNDPGAPGDDTFTYTIAPGGDTATVSVVVTCTDDAAVAVDDSATVTEDAAATAIDVLANDTDADGDAITITAATNPADGTVVLTGPAGARTGLTYEPDPDYCNDPGAPGDDTFTYTVAGGDTATVAVVVTCLDDSPVAVADSATVTIDDPATAIAVLGNDTDVDGGPRSIASVTQPANGTVVITGGGTGLTYQPAAGYCNTAGADPDDTFTYTLAPGGSTATVSVEVVCDVPPVAVDDAATVAEDALAAPIDVLANDTNPDGGPKVIASASNPANGTVVLTGPVGARTGLTYTPSPNYCNAPPGTTPDTFTYTVNGGDTATVSVTVTCVDDSPVAVNDSTTVGEDSGATPIAVLANDNDVDGGPRSVGSVTQPGNGTVVITGGGTGLSYQPDADYCNSPPGTTPDTFTYTLSPGGSTGTVSVTVTCAGDAPVVNTPGTLSYTENDPATAIAPGTTVTDPDSGALIASATVQITVNYAGAQDVLALANAGTHGPAITASVAGDTLTLTGPATAAAFQAALRDVTYGNTSEAPSSLGRVATFTVTDAGALSGSDTVGISVVPVDDAPVAVDNAAVTSEDAPAAAVLVLANDTDVDDGPKSIGSVTQPANGTVVITGGGTGLSYQPNPDYCNAPPGTSRDTFTYTLNPGGSTATVRMTVDCVADAPNVATSGGALAYTENDPATAIDPGLTVTDPDAGAMITGATVEITANFAGAQDVLALSGVHPGISAGPQAGNTLTLTGTATPAAYQSALRDVTYRNSSEGPSTLARTVTFTVTDDTALSDSATRGVTVAAVNDPPTAVDDTGTTDEDTPLSVVAPGVLANDTDVDPGDSKTVVELNGTGTLTQTLPSGASVTINANGSYTYNPLAAFQGLSTGQSASDSFTYTMQDGAGAQDTATVNVTITGVSDAPTAVADSFDAVGNTGLFVGTNRPATQAGRETTGSVLSNDTDPDTPQASLVAQPVTDAPTTLGGTITIESDGNFTYHPDDADTGVTDTFTYRVCDATPCNAGTVANATGTLSLPIAGQVWYVRNNEPAGGDGTSDTPFDTLIEAETASGTGDTVYVFDGSNTTTNLDTGYAMNASERLIGESRPLSLDPDGGGPLGTFALFPGNAGFQPTLTASNEDVVVLASNVLVDGVDLDPSGTGGGISGGAGVDAVTVQNLNVTDTGTFGTEPGIELDGTTGVNRFTGVTVTTGGSATAIGVRLNNADRVLFANTATNTISTTGAKALDVAATSLLTSRWNDITVTGSGTGAIRLNAVTGQPVLGDGAGTDLSLQTTSGATAALDIASSNTVTIDSAGTDTISATGGPGVDLRNSNGSQFFFDSVSSTNSAGDGINLDTNLTAPFVASSGAISGAAGIAVDVNGGGVGGGGVVYDGAVNDGPGQSVEVTGRDGGGVTISGNIADSADAGGGIVVSGNSGGSTTFSGASKVLSTGASNAVALGSNGVAGPSGHTVSFTGGGLDIDTTSGGGITAGNGGQLSVTGTGNSITTGTGSGLVLDNTAIDVADVTFQSISVNGAANGIRLNNTGTVGNLVVTGTGGTCTFATPTCTGGNLASTTGDAISLINTAAPSLTRVNVHDAAGNGLLASSVSALSIDTSIFVDNSDDIATSNEANLRLLNLTGTSSVANSLFREARVNDVYWTPSSGSAVMTWAGNTVGPDNAGELGSGLLLNPTGSANVTLNVSAGTFAGINGDSLRPSAEDQSVMTVNVASGTSFLDSNSGVNFSVNDDADLTYSVVGSSFVRHASHALQMIVNDNTTGSSVVRGRANNNTIGNGAADSGSRDANGISYDLEGAADVVLEVIGNTVRNTDTQGIFIQSVRFPSGTTNVGPNVDLTLRDNSVTNIDDNSAFPFGFQYGTQVEARRNSTMCLDIASNTSTGIGGAEHFRIRQRDASTFRLERLTGNAADDTNVAGFVAGQNDAGSTASVTHATTFTAVADGTCRSLP